jgi:hypothetical protein
MKMMKHIQTWLLITLLALSANGVVNAKAVSGHQNLRADLHQSQTVLNALLHQGLGEVSTTNTSESPLATKGAGKKADDVIHVTKDGVALPPGAKHKIPDNYVQNPHRPGNYGEVVDGKFKERLRIDPATPPGQKGPNYSHYHKNGKGTHYSPRPGDKDPGF